MPDPIRKGRDFLPIEVSLQTVTDSLMEQYPGPTRTQDYIHHPRRGIFGLEVEKRLPHRLTGVAFIVLFLGKKTEVNPSPTTITAHLPVPLLFRNTGNVEAGKRLNIPHDPPLRRGYEHDLVLACKRDKDIFDPRVHAAGETIHFVEKRDLFL